MAVHKFDIYRRHSIYRPTSRYLPTDTEKVGGGGVTPP